MTGESKFNKTLFLKYFQLFLIIYLIICNVIHLNTGLADNGDFSRMVNWFSSKPDGFKENWPSPGSAEYELRFFNYWLPYWEFDLPRQGSIFSSTIFLWIPGLLLNYFLFSNQQIYLPIVSIFPRILIIAFLWLILKWISKSNKNLLLTISIGIPYVLIFSSSDYIAYFNSFYQETGSIIFFLLFIISFVYLIQHPNGYKPLIVFVFSGFLLVTAKVSNLFWVPIISLILFIFAFFRKKILIYSIVTILFVVLSFVISYLSTANRDLRSINSYNSFYYGALSFTSSSEKILKELKLENFADCINVEKFTMKGGECFSRMGEKNSHFNTIRAILIDPSILFYQLNFGASNIQKLSLDYLGKFSISDPIDRRFVRLNFWSSIKYHYFPKSSYYFISIIFFIAFFLLTKKYSTENEQIVGWIVLISTIAGLLDLYMAVFGDGKKEIIKHLLMANFLYDVAIVSFFCLLFLKTPDLFKSIFKKLSIQSSKEKNNLMNYNH